eukprot:gene731-990_t
MFRVRPAQPDPTEQIRLVRSGIDAIRIMEGMADVNSPRDQIASDSRKVGNDKIQSLRRARRGGRDVAAEDHRTRRARLGEEGMVLVRTGVARTLPAQGSAENRVLTEVINQLVTQRTRLRQDMDARVLEASQDIEQEKSRLAALMAELTQSVVVCNLDGRILLYNQRARQQFRALSQAPGVAGGAELVGLGRSIYAVFDRKLVAHALESIQQRMLSGTPQPSAQLVTSTHAGQLLRVQMAPVRSAQAQAAEDPADRVELTGFVLMLDNITRDFEAESARDRVLHTLTEGTRSALANMQAALDVLDHPDLEPAARDRFLRV